MEKDKLSRKLAVILHADVVGSTNLVQKNESLAHVRIQNTFRALSETVATYDGLTCELRGDALLAEFDNTSDAVIAALTFQKSNHSLNQDLIDDIKPEIRIGIALGEVINADSTVTGAGVVIAQRLEQLADANGVVVQGAIQEALPLANQF